MKQRRSLQEQAIAVAKVRAATRLGQFRPKVEPIHKQYDRKKAKRLWQSDQEALLPILSPSSIRP